MRYAHECYEVFKPSLPEELAANLLGALKPQMWERITLRQDFIGSAHKDTQTIFINGPGGEGSNVLDDVSVTAYPDGIELAAIVLPVFKCFCTCVRFTSFGRVMIVRLKPNGHITAHVDEGKYADMFDRFHIVLQGSCLFRVNGHAFRPQEREMFWFNHKLEHEVWNDEDRPRIHMIVDAVAPMWRERRDLAMAKEAA